MLRSRAAVALCLSVLFASPAAWAQDAASAEALFSEGRRLLDAGNTKAACDKFRESERLDPAAGTVINLAACLEKLGLLASAWEKWQQAVRMLPDRDERRAGVSWRAAKIESRLPRLEIRLAGTAPSGTRVWRDELELGAPALSVALPVDPGLHKVRVEAPGREPASYEITSAEGKSDVLEVTVGPELPKEEAPKPAPAKAKATPKPVAPKPRQVERPNNTLAWVIGGAGALSLGAGIVTGVLAIDKQSTIDDDCQRQDGRLVCGQRGLDAASAGNTLATISTISIAAGVLGLGVSGYLLLTSASGDETKLGAEAIPGGGLMGFARAF